MPSIITDYTITCTSNIGTSTLTIGVFNEIDNEGEISVAKITTPKHKFLMNKICVNNMYVASQTKLYNHDLVDSLISLLYMDGHEPSIKTSANVTKRKTKEL